MDTLVECLKITVLLADCQDPSITIPQKYLTICSL